MKLGRIIVWLMRLVLGAVFIFSGFAKGVDPFGTLYKFREYLTALNFWIPDSILLTGVIALCALEFCLGVFLALGCFRRWVPRITLALMVCMLVLTGWIAIANPISDCGCFGDAFPVSNTVTFLKNILLTAGVLFLVKMNRCAPCLITPYLQWLAMLGCGGYIVGVALYGYEVQPLVDFRPFRTGSMLADLNTEADDETENFTFVYERNGERREVTAFDPQPDEAEGWVFVERKENSNAGDSNSNSELHIYTADDNEEGVTTQLLDQPYTFLILMPEPERVSKAAAWKIEALTDKAQKEGMAVGCIMAGGDDIIQMWRDILEPSVPIYKAEDTTMKMVARGNPAVVVAKDGKIVWKGTMRSVAPEQPELSLKESPRNDRNTLLFFNAVLCGWLAVLILLSLLSVAWTKIFRSIPSKSTNNPVQQTKSNPDSES